MDYGDTEHLVKSTRSKKRGSQNLYGQEMGKKGNQTRVKILKSTATLLETRGITDLKVAEIVAVAGVSSSTFYLYYEGVPEAALACAEEINQSSDEIMSIMRKQWDKTNVDVMAREFVKEYFSFWDQHSAILRLRNFAADEGNKDFFEVRKRSLEPIHFALQKKITSFQANESKAPALHAPSTVSVLIAMLERTASIVRLPSVHKATRPRSMEAAAFLVARTMTCCQV